MATTIATPTRRDEKFQVIWLAEGETFFVKFLIPEGTDSLATVTRMENGGWKIIPRRDVLAVVEGFHDSGKGCKHVRFVRADRLARDADRLDFVQPEPSPRLRVALKHAQVPTVHAQGGFENAVGYSDEIAVPDYSMSGSHGWIIPRADVQMYLDGLPPLRDSGQRAQFWLETVGWMNTPDEFRSRITDHDPAQDEPLSFYDRAWGRSVSSNRQIFYVTYDKGSRRVKRIINIATGKDENAVAVSSDCCAQVGRRLPFQP